MKGQRKINNKKNGKGGGSKEERAWERDRENDVMKPVIRFKFLYFAHEVQVVSVAQSVSAFGC